MKYFDFEGWDRDNSSSLNLVFGSREDLENFSSNNFLNLFGVDELEDEGELQKFEYPDFLNFGDLVAEKSEYHLINFNFNTTDLETFLDRFNVDYCWHLSNNNFELLHNHTINGNDFKESSSNFLINDQLSYVLITRVVTFD
jgi:hypothetical protein